MAQLRAQVGINMGMDGAVAAILLGAVKGQNLAGERLLALSSAEVPLADSTLTDSGKVEPAADIGDDTLVVYSAPYAARWHEDQALVDNLGRRYSGGSTFQGGRKSHYLSDPALQNKAELRQIVKNAATPAGPSIG